MTLNIEELSDIMKNIDICMMTTIKEDGTPESRPMSNNRAVEYPGDSYFFSYDSASAVREIHANPQVNLNYIGHHSLLNRKSVYISLEGKANIIHDKETFKQHWVKDLEIWFKDGIDTPGLTLLRVKAKRLKYWDGYEDGEIKL